MSIVLEMIDIQVFWYSHVNILNNSIIILICRYVIVIVLCFNLFC